MRMIDWLKQLLGCKDCDEELFTIHTQNKQLKKEKQELQQAHEKEVTELIEQVKDERTKKEAAEKELLELVANNTISIESLQQWYSSRWNNQQNWIYKWDSHGQATNITVALTRHDRQPIIQAAKVVAEWGKLQQGDSPETIIEAVIEYCINPLKWQYVTDMNKYGKIEYWERADISWKDRRGDCDSLAILMHNLIYELFETYGLRDHYWRLKFTGSGTLVEGHAYNIWFGEDGQWYTIESTLDLAGNYFKTWLKTPIIYNNFYGRPYGFADRNKSYQGSVSLLNSYQPK